MSDYKDALDSLTKITDNAMGEVRKQASGSPHEQNTKFFESLSLDDFKGIEALYGPEAAQALVKKVAKMKGGK